MAGARQQLQILEGAQRKIHGKSARHRIAGFERVLRPGMNVTPMAPCSRAIGYIRVTRIEALDGRLLVAGDKRRNQMLRQLIRFIWP